MSRRARKAVEKEAVGTGEMKDMMQRRQDGGERNDGVVANVAALA